MSDYPTPFEPDQDPDIVLMLKIQQGDALAFEELMNRNQDRVHSLLQNMIGNWQLAEDLTQEVFLRIYRARSTYSPDAPFSTWLYRIVHNIALNAIRSKHRHPELLFSGAGGKQSNQSSSFAFENTLLAKSGLLPARQLAQKEIQEVVRSAIDCLSERQRMALLLHRFEKMSYQQIADIMSLTPKAVKSLLCRARLNLKDLLKSYVEEGEEDK
ncbi:MAG: sigma-70 family RNA polymerase sigma factor [Planctomycetia bacterium]|nr:sigma-70 family RNA polymerase sigma factor [Planctomycetia bacterium]